MDPAFRLKLGTCEYINGGRLCESGIRKCDPAVAGFDLEWAVEHGGISGPNRSE